ncbi:MAG TPA: biotin/lipoyl-containing protein [Thermoanaerobaculia bacterium]
MKLVVRRGDADLPVEVERHGGGYRVKIGERWMEVDFVRAGEFVQSLRLEDGTQYALVSHREGNQHEVSLDGTKLGVEIYDPLARRRNRSGDDIASSGIVKALMPGRVVRVLVEEGAEVKKGTGLLILEAMKMENEIQAPGDGVVDKIFVQPGQTVEGGAELVHINA